MRLRELNRMVDTERGTTGRRARFQSNAMPGGAPTCLLRFALFIGLLSAVVTVIYLTPIPDLHFASCDRPCHDLDWPMICRFRLVLEQHQSMGGWCGDCPTNSTQCHLSGCVVADGLTRRILTANRQVPGPAIQVCQNDILVIDVVNRLSGQSLAVHWRGQRMAESPHMDGVPMITQCPISSYTTFQYKFRASEAGTHLWHSHTGNEALDGLFGPLIVRKADRIEEQKPLYDEDDPNHIIAVNEWATMTSPFVPTVSNSPEILVNGVHGVEPALPVLTVTRGLRYRVRVAHAGGGTGCPFYLTVDHHPLQVIALDGRSITPVTASSVHFAQGERFDFVLNASEEPNDYDIEVRSNCTKSIGRAILRYNSSIIGDNKENIKIGFNSAQPDETTASVVKTLSTIYTTGCVDDKSIACLAELHSFHHLKKSLSTPQPDRILVLPFDVYKTDSGELLPRLNNVTFSFPSSPIISQRYDAEKVPGQVCATAGAQPEVCSGPTCECTQIIEVPMNIVLDIVLMDQDTISTKEHVFHLHGQRFRTLAFIDAPKRGPPWTEDRIRVDLANGQIKRNLVDPVEKDTVTVPKGGGVVIRLKTNTPGYWMLHSQTTSTTSLLSSSSSSNGPTVVLRFGSDSDLPHLPDDFPKCGSWIGPQFFLI